MMILLDTNVLSELLRVEPEKKVLDWVDSLPATEFYISSITKAEIELGIALLPDGRRKHQLKDAARLMFDEFPGRCLSFDSCSASNYACIVVNRQRIGRPVSVEDAQIAAISVTNKMVLATRNTRDFENIDGLTVFNPWLSA